MSATPTASTVSHMTDRGAEVPGRGVDRALNSPAVLVACLLGSAASVADAASDQADLGLAGVVFMAVALAVTLMQAVRARVGRPSRTSRLAATTAASGSLVVAAFLASVGVLERMGPQVTSSTAFAAGVTGMSVVLFVVLPLSLGVFGWAVSQDRRLGAWMRVLPWVLLLVTAGAGVTVAVTAGSLELWFQAAATAVVGALLTGFSAGSSRAAR